MNTNYQPVESQVNGWGHGHRGEGVDVCWLRAEAHHQAVPKCPSSPSVSVISRHHIDSHVKCELVNRPPSRNYSNDIVLGNIDRVFSHNNLERVSHLNVILQV